MADLARIKRLLPMVAKLPATGEHWAVTVRRARTWVQEFGQRPYRPYLVLTISNAGFIMGTKVLATAPNADDLVEELLGMMRKPVIGAGSPRRPAMLGIDDAAMSAALEPYLAQVGVEVFAAESLPMVEEPLAELERAMNKNAPTLPSLSEMPGVSDALLARYFTLSAAYYQAAPWRRLTDEFPVEIRYPATEAPRLVVVMGNMGEVFGLSAFEHKDDLLSVYRQPTGTANRPKDWSSIAIMYDEAPTMSFADLDAIEAHHWPIAAPNAYPMLARIQHGHDMVTPLLTDVTWIVGALAGLLAVLPDLDPFRLRAGHRLGRTVTIDAIDGPVEVAIRCPAFDPYE